MDDIGPRRSPAFYWAGFLSHLVSNFKKRCQFGPFQSPFSQTNRSVSKAQTVESSQIGENVRARKHFVSARRTLRGGGCDADGARCAWDSDCSISAFQLSWKLSRNAETPPTGRERPPASPVWTPHCSQAQGPWRPIASCASFHDTVIHAEGSPPGAWLLKEHPCGSGIM